MVETVLFPDPALELTRLLKSVRRERVVDDVPAGWGWGQPLIVITDVGMGGQRRMILEDSRIVIDVYAPTRSAASLISREMRAVIAAWAQMTGGPVMSTADRPKYYPEPATRTPGYTFSCDFTFRGESFTA